MIFSVTEIDTYQRCRRKWDLSSLNRQGQTSIWPQMNTLGLGSLFHMAGEAWIKEPDTDFELHFHNQATIFYKNLMVVCDARNYKQSDQQDQSYWEAVTLGKAMARNYQAYWKTPLPADYVLVRPEQQFVVPIPDTEHCGCKEAVSCCNHNACTVSQCQHLEAHYLEGTLDAVIADSQGRLFPYERKTFAAHPNIKHLNRTPQFVKYTWILTQAVKHWGMSNEVAGFLYDGIWKRAEPPKTGQYKDSTDSLFLRHYMQHTQERLDECERELATVTKEMADPNTPITHTIPAVKGCIDCLDMMDLCDRISDEQDTTLMLRTLYTKRDFSPAFKDFYATAGADSE
jgi:hypothetical protein